mgnify:CR=1 FL=1|jgi:hypothetical protein
MDGVRVCCIDKQRRNTLSSFMQAAAALAASVYRQGTHIQAACSSSHLGSIIFGACLAVLQLVLVKNGVQ